MWCKAVKSLPYNSKNEKSSQFPNFSTKKSLNSNEDRSACVFSKTSSYSRSLADSEMNLKNVKKSDKSFVGYINPVLTTLEFRDCFVDMLHLKLRITDALESHLIDQLLDWDNPLKDDASFLNKPRLCKYYEFLKNNCKISKPFYIKENKIFSKQLSGNNKMKLFTLITLKDMWNIFFDLKEIQTYENCIKNNNFDNYMDLREKFIDINKIFDIWKKFINTYIAIKNNTYSQNDRIRNIKEDTYEWLKLFVSKYSANRITVYEHIFSEHLYEMVDDLGNLEINDFTMQGLEKLNNLTTNHYFSSTNKHENFLIQLIKKRNRVEIFNIGCELDDYDYENQLFQINGGNEDKDENEYDNDSEDED